MKNEYLKVFEEESLDQLPINYRLLRAIQVDPKLKSQSIQTQFGKCELYTTSRYSLSYYKPVVNYKLDETF